MAILRAYTNACYSNPHNWRSAYTLYVLLDQCEIFFYPCTQPFLYPSARLFITPRGNGIDETEMGLI